MARQQTVADIAGMLRQDAPKPELTAEGLLQKHGALERERDAVKEDLTHRTLVGMPVKECRARLADITQELEEIQAARAKLAERAVAEKEQAEAKRIASVRQEIVARAAAIREMLAEAQPHFEQGFGLMLRILDEAQTFRNVVGDLNPAAMPYAIAAHGLEERLARYLAAACRKNVKKHMRGMLPQMMFEIDIRTIIGGVADGDWAQHFHADMGGDMANLASIPPKAMFTMAKPIAAPRPLDPSEMPFAGWPAEAIPTTSHPPTITRAEDRTRDNTPEGSHNV